MRIANALVWQLKSLCGKSDTKLMKGDGWLNIQKLALET
jgi:hypothetical protein